MNRRELIEKAARAIADHYEHQWEGYEADGQRVVDELLPQVSTVEELEALSSRSWLMSESLSEPVRPNEVLPGELAVFGPFTVVWQP